VKRIEDQIHLTAREFQKGQNLRNAKLKNSNDPLCPERKFETDDPALKIFFCKKRVT